ncbi:MAG: hypothetical protein HY924_11540 [Elusimicrobia bacterium]|nr:hypothetical protein [Elusimicrobiota bacterium]
MLEDAAAGLGAIKAVHYADKFHAVEIDNRAVYFPPVGPRDLAVLCRSLAADDRVGVSLGDAELVWGVPKGSDVALVLKLADLFLADIVFGRRETTAGYRYAKRYKPIQQAGEPKVAAFFKIHKFKFRVEKQEVQLVRSALDVSLVPLAAAKAADGANLPDMGAIKAGVRFQALEKNAKHLAKNMSYYRREKVLDQACLYGEVAAFLRGIRDHGADLLGLAMEIEASPRYSVGPDNSAQSLRTHWLAYLKSIETKREFRNWSAPPYTLQSKQR